MRVVIDTNVFVSSFFGGNPRKIIDLWKRGQVTLCLSGAVLDEYLEVLRRFGLPEGDLESLLSLFAKGVHILFTTKVPSLRVVKQDPDDDKFVACAVALNAEAVITGAIGRSEQSDSIRKSRSSRPSNFFGGIDSSKRERNWCPWGLP